MQPWYVAILVVTVAPLVALMTARMARRDQSGDNRIAEYRDDVDKLRKRLDESDQTMAALRHEVAQMREEIAIVRGREMLWDWHAGRVEDQVREHGGDPWPRPARLLEIKP